MFPTFLRLLKLLNVPLRPFPMRVTQYQVQTGDVYLMPPFHGLRLFPEGFAPRKIADLLRFQSLVRATAPIMRDRDRSITTQQFLDSLGVPEDFLDRFLYPFLQAGWGVSLEEIKTFMVYDIFRYSYLNTSVMFIPYGWKEIDGGTQTYVRAISAAYQNIRVKMGAGIRSVHAVDGGYAVEDARGQTEVFDTIVLATNANQAAAILAGLPGSEAVRQLLNRITYFETTIALHGDQRLMPAQRKHWSTVNIRYDGKFSQISTWKHGDSGTPIFKSWVTHDEHLPDQLYAVTKYLHPRVDADYFQAQAELQAYQGKANIWLAGMYMQDVDCHESAILSAVRVAQALAPQSARLKQLKVKG